MNQSPDIDRVLSRWFDDGPTTMPDRVVGVVAERIGRQPQRPSWRLRWRPQMTTQTKLAVATAAGILVAIAGWSLLPHQPTIGEPTPSVLAPPTPSVAPSGAPPSSTRPAATFAATGFNVPFHVSLAGGWLPVTDGSTPTAVSLRRGLLNIGIWSIADSRVRPPGSDAVSYDAMEPWPADLYGWVKTIPACTAQAPQDTTVGGRSGVIIDYRCRDLIETKPDATVEERIAATIVMANPGGFLGQYGTTQSVNRFIEIRTGPSAGVVVLLSPSVGTFAADASAVDALLSTLVFD